VVERGRTRLNHGWRELSRIGPAYECLGGSGGGLATDERRAVDLVEVRTASDLGRLLRELRRREARRRGGSPPTYRELAAKTGWALGSIGEYFAGRVLPPTDKFDELIRLLGASPAEQGALATIRDRVEERRRVDTASIAGGTRPATLVARELPPDVSAFTGRDASLVELEGRLAGRSGEAAVPIAVVSGTAGVGKTALAVHWAHRVAERFPDGQLYADLRGYDSDEPVDAGDVLAGFLRGLGLDGKAVPADPAERGARYRSLLAGRRVLVVLDNARSAQQIRPLLPGTPSCLVLVTSRDDLAGLVARDGAHRVVLDPLTPDEAVTLLRTLVGSRVDGEPHAARVLAERCGYLPLALRLVAEMAAARPGARLADLAADLNGERDRLGLLDAGGDPRAVRTVLSWSIRHLTAPAARAFVLLGLHPGHDFDRHVVAALTATPVGDAARQLDELARAHVVASTGRHRYAMHDLMRAYSVERAEADLEPGPARAAVIRLLDYYLATAAEADHALFPTGLDLRSDPRPDTHPTVAVEQPDEAQRWLDDERPNLVAVCQHAAAHGWPRHGVRLSLTLFRYLDARAYRDDALTVHSTAELASRGDGPDRGDVLRNLGLAVYRVGRVDDAIAYMREAVAYHQRASDRHGRARVLGNLGALCGSVGRYREAVGHLESALPVLGEVNDRFGEAVNLGNLGDVCARMGRYTEAAEHIRRSVAIHRELGDRWSEAYALAPLGVVHARTGDPTRAMELLRRTLDIAWEFSDRRFEAEVLIELAEVCRRLGRHTEAIEHLDRARDIAREIGEPLVEMAVFNGLGDTLRAMRQTRDGLGHHRSALAMARRMGDRYQLARALDGIAHARHETGHTALARRHWTNALAIFTELEVPEAEQVRGQLAEFDGAVVGPVARR
jgi:tetratricopeptide (TPR) repeat protein